MKGMADKRRRGSIKSDDTIRTYCRAMMLKIGSSGAVMELEAEIDDLRIAALPGGP
jgi:hypothetical protein